MSNKADELKMKNRIRDELKELKSANSLFKENASNFKYVFGVERAGRKVDIETNITHKEMKYLVCYVFWQIEDMYKEKFQAEVVESVISSAYPLKEFEGCAKAVGNMDLKKLANTYGEFKGEITDIFSKCDKLKSVIKDI
ncbi:hypothetical protein [Bacillus altitudinis]|uniref:hypothetical protein n=1 Tax=Bacillus altitudinis TaxID=293387 RepID=UPI0011A0A1F5|nr:hypothetical protein [Bacillus altitudinis]